MNNLFQKACQASASHQKFSALQSTRKGKCMTKLIRVILIAGCLLPSGSGVAQTDKAVLEETAALCASTLGIAAIITDAELSEMVFRRDARWWRNILVQLTSESEADQRIRAGMDQLKDDYNAESTSFSAILEMGRECSEAKIQLEE